MQFRKSFVVTAVLVILIWASFHPLAVAVETTTAAPAGGYLQYQEPPKTSVSIWSTLAYVVTLLIVFVAVVGLAYLTSRFLAQRFTGAIGRDNKAAVLGTLALAPNRTIHLVEMSGRFFWIGVTEHSMTVLYELTDESEIERLRESKAASTTPASFQMAITSQMDALRQMRDRFPQIFSSDEGRSSNGKDDKK